MDRAIKTNQAYYEIPWRKQLQRIGLFLAILVLLGLIAGIYLSVNSKAATIGRQIQNDHILISELENSIADKQSQLAILTSAGEMEKRALEMGFYRTNTDKILYLVVKGYNGRTPVLLASEQTMFVPSSHQTLPTEFSQSLIDWLQEKLTLPTAVNRLVKP